MRLPIPCRAFTIRFMRFDGGQRVSYELQFCARIPTRPSPTALGIHTMEPERLRRVSYDARAVRTQPAKSQGSGNLANSVAAGTTMYLSTEHEKLDRSRPRARCSDPTPDVDMLQLTNSWIDWRQGVVAVIRDAFRGVLDSVEDTDIDWDAWRPLFEEGRSPKAAVDKAYLRDLR